MRSEGCGEVRWRLWSAAVRAALVLLPILGLPSTAEPQEQEDDSITVVERGTPGVDGWDIAELPFKVIFFPLYLVSLGLEWAGGAVADAYMYSRIVYWNQQLNDRGIYPTIASLGNYSGTGAGLTLGVPPGERAFWGYGFGGATVKGYWRVDARLGYGPEFGQHEEEASAYGVNAFGILRHRPRDEYYGVGNNSSKDDRSDYRLDLYDVGGEVALIPTGELEFQVTGRWQKTESGLGANDRLPSVDSIFEPGQIPGFGEEEEYLRIGAAADFQKGRIHALERGGYWVEAGYVWNKSNTDGVADFGRLNTGAGIELPFDRRIRSLYLAILYESVRPSGAGEIAFYRLPWVGGSNTLPAYRSARFRDRDMLLGQAEYRYRVWDNPRGVVGVDASVLLYGGMVAPRMSEDFAFDELHPSYGLALSVLTREATVAYLSVAGGDEGVRVHFTFRLGF